MSVFLDLSQIDANYMNNGCILQANCYEDFRQHKLYVQLQDYFGKVLEDALSPNQLCDFEYASDSVINIQRLYSVERNDEFGKLLLEYLDAKRTNKWRDFTPGDFIDKWIQKFGLGHHLSITLAGEGAGIMVRLHKAKDDKKGRLLADEGFGVTKLIATLINIELGIILTKPDRGGGIFFVDERRIYDRSRRINSLTLAIEEPEVHLHPRYQSLLADMFMDAYNSYNIHFIIETHSEYMIRKFQTFVAKKDLAPNEVSLQYVHDADPERRPKGEPHVKHIPIREDGTLADTFGSGFFDEADDLAMELLTIKAMR